MLEGTPCASPPSGDRLTSGLILPGGVAVPTTRIGVDAGKGFAAGRVELNLPDFQTMTTPVRQTARVRYPMHWGCHTLHACRLVESEKDHAV